MASRKHKTNILPAVFFSVFGHAMLAILLLLGSAGSLNMSLSMNNKLDLLWVSLDSGNKTAAVNDALNVKKMPQEKIPQETARADDVVMLKKQSSEIVREKALAVSRTDILQPSFAADEEGSGITQAGQGADYQAAASAALPVVRAMSLAVDFAEPSYREKTLPVYPRLARLRGYEGVVLVATEILPDGNVGNLRIKKSSGYAILDEAAMAAVKKWKFEPARKMGKPCAAWRDHVIRFSLNEDNSRT